MLLLPVPDISELLSFGILTCGYETLGFLNDFFYSPLYNEFDVNYRVLGAACYDVALV